MVRRRAFRPNMGRMPLIRNGVFVIEIRAILFLGFGYTGEWFRDGEV